MFDADDERVSRDEREPFEAALLLRTWNDGEAAVIRQILEGYGIPSQAVSDVPHTVLPVSVDGLGEIRIYVPADCLDEANTILAEYRRSGLDLVKGGRDDREEPEGEPSVSGS